jgi:hypothetical protein
MAGKSDLQVDSEYVAEFESRGDTAFAERNADALETIWSDLVMEEDAHRKLAELKRRFAKLEAGEQVKG